MRRSAPLDQPSRLPCGEHVDPRSRKTALRLLVTSVATVACAREGESSFGVLRVFVMRACAYSHSPQSSTWESSLCRAGGCMRQLFFFFPPSHPSRAVRLLLVAAGSTVTPGRTGPSLLRERGGGAVVQWIGRNLEGAPTLPAPAPPPSAIAAALAAAIPIGGFLFFCCF